MSRGLRIFISSPGDVQEERLRAHLVVQKLARDYARFFRIEAYLWEHEPMLASGHFQDAIELPSASDIMVLVVYSRLGTPLPERSAAREYRGLDGRSPVTGTEWEFEEALQANRHRGAPDLLAYRKLGDPGTSLADSGKRAEQQRQWDSLQEFWHRHFETGTLFLAGSAKFSTLEEFDQKLESDLVALIERRIAHGASVTTEGQEALWLRGSPFRGLATYDFGDNPIFFGRDAQVREASTRIQIAAASGCAFLLVLGASGSGKSSVARAGILPALFAPKAITGVAVWRRVVLRPGEGDQDPIIGLARALCTGVPSSGIGLPELVSSPDQVKEFAAHLEASASNPSYTFQQALDRVIASERIRRSILPHETARLVLLVDQMEELFTRAIEPARRAMFVRILNGLARSGCVWVVATMRNDLWHRAVEVPQLVELVEAGARLDLLAPNGAEIIEIVRRPAAAAGLTFETDSGTGVGLDAVIAHAAVEEPGALPLLSVMLDTLYGRDVATSSRSIAKHQLRFSTYRELGELTGAIARRAEEIFNAVAATDPDAAQAFPRLLRALVTASAQGTAVTSRAARLDQFGEGGPEARLISAFVSENARLLVAATSNKGTEIRVAHEALIEKWPRARVQIDLDRRDLDTRSRIEALMLRSVDETIAGEQNRALLQGLNLAEGSDLVKRWGIDASTPIGAYVQQSARAESWRRRRALVATLVLLGVFASLAAFATLQWSRADLATQSALRAEATERDARAAAEVERNRATENEKRTAEALRATKRETAQTLATQVVIATGQHDVRRALALAVKAATLDKDALRSGERPTTEPALLQALAGAREVLHVTHATQSWWMPYTFVDDGTLAYGDAQSGVIQVDLRRDPTIVSRVQLGGGPQIRHLAVIRSRALLVVALANELRIIDANSGAVRAAIPFQARINGIDVDADGHRIVVAAGTDIGLIDLDAPTAAVMVALPDATALTGQARFARQGKTVIATAGNRMFAYDLESGTFARLDAELSGAGIGLDQPALQSVLANGVLPFIRIEPDPAPSARLFTYAPLELQAIEPEAKASETLRTNTPDYDYRGISAIDQERRGQASTLAVVQSRSRDEQLDFLLRYVSGGEGVQRGSDGRLLPAFAELSVVPADFAKRKPDSCRVSPQVTFMACQYSDKDTQGIVVWRMLGGDHVFARSAERFNASSGLQLKQNELLVSSGDGLIRVADGQDTKIADLPEAWQLVGTAGEIVAAMSPSTKQGRLLRINGAHVAEASPSPFPAEAIVLAPLGDLALVQTADRLNLIKSENGDLVWSVPIPDLHRAEFGPADQIIAVSGIAVYAIDRGSGRILNSHPLTLTAKAPLAIDREKRKLAYLDALDRVQLLDLASGATEVVNDLSSVPTRLAWTNNGQLLIGGRDGSVTARPTDADRAWAIPSPFVRGFQASAWPGQPQQGVVLDLAISQDGMRLAVMRQDIKTIDLHDLTNGHLLTRLTPPSLTLTTPAKVEFGPTDDLITAWAFHPMMRDRPRYIAVHRLPRNLDEALAAASGRLAIMNTIWSPTGPRL